MATVILMPSLVGKTATLFISGIRAVQRTRLLLLHRLPIPSVSRMLAIFLSLRSLTSMAMVISMPFQAIPLLGHIISGIRAAQQLQLLLFRLPIPSGSRMSELLVHRLHSLISMAMVILMLLLVRAQVSPSIFRTPAIQRRQLLLVRLPIPLGVRILDRFLALSSLISMAMATSTYSLAIAKVTPFISGTPQLVVHQQPDPR